MSEYDFRSYEDLVRCLEQYSLLRGRYRSALDDRVPGGGDGLPERYDLMLRQNRAVDRAMRRLYWMHRLSHRLLDAYYRDAWHEQAEGWQRALLRAGLPHHPQTQRERSLLEQTFEGLLRAAIESLWHASRIRHEHAS